MRNDHGPRDDGMRSSTILTIAAIIAVLAVAFIWHPWSRPRVADNSSPETTIGSSPTRPAPPSSPTSAATTPAAPSTR
jgi:hypothetical protein